MTIDAIINENIRVQSFHLWLRTITNAVMDDRTIVKSVELTVTIKEFPKTVRKFIFFIASGKLLKVKPWAPISASGSAVMSPLVLKTLIKTSKNGKIKQIKRIRRTTHMIA